MFCWHIVLLTLYDVQLFPLGAEFRTILSHISFLTSRDIGKVPDCPIISCSNRIEKLSPERSRRPVSAGVRLFQNADPPSPSSLRPVPIPNEPGSVRIGHSYSSLTWRRFVGRLVEGGRILAAAQRAYQIVISGSVLPLCPSNTETRAHFRLYFAPPTTATSATPHPC